ncbi:MAG: feruloyl-CoA synthase [Burkholderiales bacterium]
MNALPRRPEELFADPAVLVEARPDGTRLLSSKLALPEFARCTGVWLEQWADETPDAVFLAERGAGGAWVELTYARMREQVYRVATWLLGLGLSADRPVLVLSGNGLDHALLMHACLHVGVPVSSLSAGNSLQSKDFGKLKAAVELLRPGVIFADDPARFGPALAAIAPLHDAVVVTGSAAPAPAGAISFAEVERTVADAEAVRAAFGVVGPETIAKFLFTSGSIDAPKAVITTQRMMCSNAEMKSVIWRFLNTTKPVVVDWLPWSHVFGGSHNMNIVLRFGGSLYLDEGKPLPALLDRTIRNLTDVAPTIYFSVPLAYDLLVRALRDDAALRRNFFSRLQIIFYAGAALPQSTWEELERLAVMELGHPVVMLSSWGSTETAPACTDCHFQAVRSGVIGVPVPGTTLKLVPVADKLEVRVKGPNVFPGYWRAPELTASAFDEEGFYLIGDAVEFVDRDRPDRGLLFDGRIAEDFKLLSGTWVHVGSLRVAGISAFAPLALDIVVTGHDRDEIGFLVFPNFTECRKFAGLPPDTPADEVLRHPNVKLRIREGLVRLKREGGGSSTYPGRVLLLAEPPSPEAGELTEKGYINQRAVRSRRADRVLELYGDVPEPEVITLT